MKTVRLAEFVLPSKPWPRRPMATPIEEVPSAKMVESAWIIGMAFGAASIAGFLLWLAS